MFNTTKEIAGRLDKIISLLQRMPEIEAAVLLQMMEEKETAAFRGKKAADIWIIPDPEKR